MTNDYITYHQNPRLKYLFGFFGEKVPTKQDGYKLLKGLVLENDDGSIFDQIYARNPDNDAKKAFKKTIGDIILQNSDVTEIIAKPRNLEVLITVSCNQRRFYEVDVDNLAKMVLDSMNGIIYEDDVQVSSLICKKYIEPSGENGILIGIVEISNEERGFGEDFSLFGQKE